MTLYRYWFCCTQHTVVLAPGHRDSAHTNFGYLLSAGSGCAPPPPLGRLGSPCSDVSALKGAGRAGVLGSRPTPNMHSSFMRAYKCLLSWRYLVLWLYNVNGLSLLACPSSSLSFPILSLSTLLSCPSGVPSWTGSFWRTLRADLLCRIQWP